MTSIDCVIDAKAKVGEGPVWDERAQALWWVDIEGCKLHRFDPASGADRVWPMKQEIGCIALRKTGSLVAGMRRGFHFVDSVTGKLTPIHNPEPDKPDNRFNDGATDPRGRFIAGTMRMAHAGKAPDGALYALDPDLSMRRLLDGFWTVNGLAFSPDGRTMYVSDSNTEVQTIWALDYDAGNGSVSNRRVFATTFGLAGRPDGGAIDADGCYWMAGVGGAELVRFTPAGKVDRSIRMPTGWPTKIAFGGPALGTMYVTSIRRGDDPKDPLAGGLFALDAGVKGWRVPRFAG